MYGVVNDTDVVCKPVFLLEVVIKPSNEYRGCLEGGWLSVNMVQWISFYCMNSRKIKISNTIVRSSSSCTKCCACHVHCFIWNYSNELFENYFCDEWQKIYKMAPRKVIRCKKITIKSIFFFSNLLKCFATFLKHQQCSIIWNWMVFFLLYYTDVAKNKTI